jgi:hypothetical protein
MKKIKLHILSLLALLCFFSFTIVVNAGSFSLSSSASTTSPTAGNSFTVTFKYSSDVAIGLVSYSMTYDNTKLELTDGTSTDIRDYNGTEKSDSVTFTFKAKDNASGSATINFKVNSALDMENEQPLSGSYNTSKTVTIASKPAATPSQGSSNSSGNNSSNNNKQNNTTKSSNNNLSSITLSKGNLDPEFNKDKTDYTASVENDVVEIAIGGTTEDNKASVDGFKTYPLEEGSNKIVITVTAQNGNVKTYNIDITRKELDPITVKTEDGKSLNVVRKKEQLTAPNEYFKESKIVLNEKDEIPTLEYNVNNKKIVLLGLKDDKGTVTLYRYEDDKYYPYLELKSNSVVLINVYETKDIPSIYKKVSLKINDIEYIAYQKNNSSYYLVYGTSLETGETKLYTYESKEKTLQLYDKTIDNAVETEQKRVLKRNYVIYALAGFMIVTYFGILVSLITKVSKKKKRREKEQEIENIKLEEEARRKKKEQELRELEEELRRKEEKITKKSNKKEKSDKIEENINKEKKGRKKKSS